MSPPLRSLTTSSIVQPQHLTKDLSGLSFPVLLDNGARNGLCARQEGKMGVTACVRVSPLHAQHRGTPSLTARQEGNMAVTACARVSPLHARHRDMPSLIACQQGNMGVTACVSVLPLRAI